MTRQIILATLCIFIICVGEINGQDDEKVKCEASALRMGGEGKITCLFPKNLDQQNVMDITIRHFGPDMSDTTVLECLWDKELDCPNRRLGYITKVASRTLNVMISNVTEAHLGKYRCTMMDNNPIEGEDCPFLINDTFLTIPPPSTTMAEVYPDQTTSLNNGSSSNPDLGLIVGAIVGAVLVVGVVLGILVFLIVRYRRRKRCHRDLEAPAEEGTDEEQEKALLPDGQGPDQNGIDGTPVLNSSGVQENTGDMQGNNEQNETLDQQEGSPAADRSAVPPAIHSTTDLSVEDAEETLEDLGSAPSTADMSGDVSGKTEDKAATTGEEGIAKPVYPGRFKLPTDSRTDTNSHLESSTDVPPVASDTTQSGVRELPKGYVKDIVSRFSEGICTASAACSSGAPAENASTGDQGGEDAESAKESTELLNREKKGDGNSNDGNKETTWK